MLNYINALLKLNNDYLSIFRVTPTPPFQCWYLSKQLHMKKVQFRPVINNIVRVGGERKNGMIVCNIYDMYQVFMV